MRVTALIVTYDNARFLPRAIDSALAQQFDGELEVLVVDDGSTDSTPSLLRRYAGIRVIRQDNAGHLAAFSTGLAAATGDYVALLDGDDEWLPGRIRSAVEIMEARPEVGLVHGDMQVIDGRGRLLHPSFFQSHGIAPTEGDLLGTLMARNVVTTTAVTARLSLRHRWHPIPAWARAQDWWLAVRTAEVAEIACAPGPVARYRKHGGNMNLGQDKRVRLMRRELPLRRWMLTEAATERVDPEQRLAALAAYDSAAATVAEASGEPRPALTPAEPAAARARARAGELVAAAALDPFDRELRTALAAWRRDLSSCEPPLRLPMPDARSFVTLADGRELSAQLLRAYASVIDEDDDATLAIATDDPGSVLELIDASGVSGPDLLAIPAGGSPDELALRADAVLTERLAPGAMAGLPAIAADGVRALRSDATSFCIAICAPRWSVAPSWGDLHFARAIQQELHRRGHPCAIEVISGWPRARDARHDVVIHLKGLTEYQPSPAQLNVLWCISHPELLSAAECERFDLAFVASAAFAARMDARCAIDVGVLEQATDPRVFFPEHDPAHARELVFVGNSRRVMRRVVADLLPTSRDLAVWGADWEPLIGARHIAGEYLPNDEVRRAYSSAAIVLNDHWDDMREHGFLSNRLYDAVAAGGLVVSDPVAGMEQRFAGAVVPYGTRDELHATVERLLASPSERAERVAAGRAAVLAGHTFAHRVDALLEHVEAALGHQPRAARVAA